MDIWDTEEPEVFHLYSSLAEPQLPPQISLLFQSPGGLSKPPFCNSHPAKTRTGCKGQTENSLETPSPSPQLSTHSPKLTGPGRGTWGHVGMPAGSQLMVSELSTHAYGRSGGEKAAAPTGGLCRAGETQKDSLVPEFPSAQTVQKLSGSNCIRWRLLRL